MTVSGYISSLRKSLEKVYSVEEARSIALRVVCELLNWEASKIYSSGEQKLNQGQLDKLFFYEQDLLKGRPLQYVLGYTEFAGLRIRVKEGCLIPRPETEQMFSLAANDLESIISTLDNSFEYLNVLDICTGSGCLAYAFASEFSGLHVYGCDISDEALSIACKQRIKSCEAKPVFFKADLLSAPPTGLPKFDMIVSNPPYILEKERVSMKENVLSYEPELALFVPDEDPLLHYKAIKHWADVLLKPEGHIWLEVNENLAQEVSNIFPGSSILKDFNDKDRFVYVSKN